MAGLQTIREVLERTEAFFAKAGLETPKVEAGWLLAGALKCKRLDLFLQADRPLTAAELDKLRPMVKRRAAGEPLQYILGFAEFHNLSLPVAPGVLIPRPETEGLVELVLKRLDGKPAPKLVDLGTGSGAIAFALASALPDAKVLAIDASPAALQHARQSAESLGLRDRVAFRKGDWLQGLEIQADAIISNPPYLTREEWQNARPEVRNHEPESALVAADDGMADLKTILQTAGACLVPGGFVALETGIHHGPPLRAFALEHGWRDVDVLQDDNLRDRYLIAVHA